MTQDANDIARRHGVDGLRAAWDAAPVLTPADLDPEAVERINDHEIAAAYGGNGRASNSRIKLVAFNEIQLGAEPRYLVKGIIPRTGLIVIYGPPKSGKSFWTFDLAMHVALGREYRGRRVQQGPVVYCAFEGQSGVRQRVEAFRQRFLSEQADNVPFFLEPVTLDLVADHRELADAIRAALNAVQPVAVVLDTLNRSLRGSESSDQDMTAYVKAADAIREAFECAVLVVHHSGIEGSRPRGHTSLTGAADAQLAVKRDGAGNVIVTVEWMKDGPEGETLANRLEPVDVGVDANDDPITSCVIVAAEMPENHQAKTRKLPPTQATMLSLLREAGSAGLTTEEWNTAAKLQGIGTKRAATLYDTRVALKSKKLVYEYADTWHVTDRS